MTRLGTGAGESSVTSTDLDIRNLDFVQDDITIYGSQGVPLQQKVTTNDLIVTLDGEVVSVSATDLDIRDLTSATDSVSAVQSGTWNIGTLTSISNVVHIDDNGGSITVDGTVAVSGTVAVTQSGTWDEVGINDSGNVITVDGSGTAGSAATGVITVQGITSMTPIQIGDNSSTISIDDGAGSITVDGTVAATQSGTWNIGTVTTITNVVHVDDNSSTLSIDDGTGSITVDGTVTANLAAGTNNIGDVDVLSVPSDPFGANADAASATGSISAKLRFIASTGIPITGTVAVTQSGTWDEIGINDSGNVITVDGSGTAGTAASGVVTVQGIASMTPVQVGDNSSSLTVDAPVGTPVFVRLSDGSSAISTLPVSLASVPSHAVTNAGTFAVQVDGSALTSLQLIDDVVHSGDAALSKYAVVGAVFDDTSTVTVTENQAQSVRMSSRRVLYSEGPLAHDAADAANPLKIGLKAIAHGSNPTAVAASDVTDAYANRHGIQFVIGGHPNILTKQLNITDADGAQTDADILGAISSGTKYVVTGITVTADNANTSDVGVRIGFGTANTPSNDGTGIILSHPGIPKGGGVSIGNGGGILGVGGDGAELRITSEDPVGGAIDVVVHYYTIES